MRWTTWTVVLILGLSAGVIAQDAPKAGCPTISVKGPENITPPGSILTFTVNLTNGPDFKASYEWSVNWGTIEDGQGTPSILVRPFPDGTSDKIKATVTIGGLPYQCNAVASDEVIVNNRPFVCGLSERWGRLNSDDQKARLMNASLLLQRNPNTVLLFMISLKADDTFSQAQRRVSFIRNYLLRNYLIPPDRLQIAFRNYDLSETAVFIFPPEDLVGFLKSFDATQSLETLRPTDNIHR